MTKALWSFTKSVIVAGAAGTAVAWLIIILIFWPPPAELNDLMWLGRLLLEVAAISFAVVLTGTLFLGVPTTLVLRHFGMEREITYVVAGLVFGFLLPVMLGALFMNSRLELVPFAFLGAGCGAVAGRTWWRTFRHAAAAEE